MPKETRDHYVYNVYLGRKCIDTVFYGEKQEKDDVRRSLVNHDGYDPEIRVVKARRKMKDEFEVQGNYGQGWECVTTEETLQEARKRLKEYDENETGYSHRIKRIWVPV